MKKPQVEISDIVEINFIEVNKDTIIFSPKVQEWCKLPYKNNKLGCSSYGKKSCPPNSPYLETKLNDYNFFYLIVTKFDLKIYKERRAKIHPDWSNDQLKNSRHWQSRLRKKVKDYISDLIIRNSIIIDQVLILVFGSGFKILNKEHCSMESVGIHVFHTLKKNNINYEIKPKNFIVMVSLICSNKQIRENNRPLYNFLEPKTYFKKPKPILVKHFI